MQDSEYVRSSYKFNKLLKMLGFLISKSFEYGTVYMQELRRVPNMSIYSFIRLNNTWICLSMPERDWILLSFPEYASKCLNKMFWLCQGS